MGARAVNAVLGFWLFLSAFLWTHRIEQFHNAWITGLVVVTMAVWGLQGVRRARLVNVAAGAWLLLTNFLWLGDWATFWNHAVVGVGLALFGVAPSLRSVRQRGDVQV